MLWVAGNVTNGFNLSVVSLQADTGETAWISPSVPVPEAVLEDGPDNAIVTDGGVLVLDLFSGLSAFSTGSQGAKLWSNTLTNDLIPPTDTYALMPSTGNGAFTGQIVGAVRNENQRTSALALIDPNSGLQTAELPQDYLEIFNVITIGPFIVFSAQLQNGSVVTQAVGGFALSSASPTLVYSTALVGMAVGADGSIYGLTDALLLVKLPPAPGRGRGGLSGGAVAAIVVVFLLLVLAGLAVTAFFVYKKLYSGRVTPAARPRSVNENA